MDKKKGRKEKGGCERGKLGQKRIGSTHEAEGARLELQGLLQAAFLPLVLLPNSVAASSLTFSARFWERLLVRAPPGFQGGSEKLKGCLWERIKASVFGNFHPMLSWPELQPRSPAQ